MQTKLKPLVLAIAISGLSFPALASDGEIADLKIQVQTLMKRLAELEAKQTKAEDKAVAREKIAAESGKAVKLYGQLRLSGDHYSDDFGAAAGSTVKSNASRLGVKGEVATSLGDTNLIYQAEIQYGAADNVANEIAWREGFAGLTGGWGRVRLGRLDVPYKTTLTAIDPWNDNAPQSRGFGGRQGSSALHSSYFTNTIEYVSPSINGFKVGAWMSKQLDDETSNIHDAGPISNYQGGEAKGLGVKFKQGPWYAGLDFIDIDSDRIGTTSTTSTANLTTGAVTSTTTFKANANMDNGSGWQVAGGYKANAWSVGALYEDVEDLGLGKNIFLTGSYKLGKTTLIASLGRNTDAKQYANRDIDTWSLGAKYALTKSSELFAAWVDRSENAHGGTASMDYQILTLGLNAKFGY